MMIQCNGEPREVAATTTVARLVTELTGHELTSAGVATNGTPLGIAVALNYTIVPRSQWATTTLHEADSVEIVTAVQGG